MANDIEATDLSTWIRLGFSYIGQYEGAVFFWCIGQVRCPAKITSTPEHQECNIVINLQH